MAECDPILREAKKCGLIQPRTRICVHRTTRQLLQRSDVGMSKHDQVEPRFGGFDVGRGGEQTSSAVARGVVATRMRAVVRQRRCEVRMQPAKRANRQWVSEYASNEAISFVFARSQPIAVLDVNHPASDLSSPWAKAIVDAHVFTKDLSAPTVVVAGDHDDFHPGVDDVGQRGQRSKSDTRNDRPPLEPEFEQIAVDDERLSVGRNMSQERDDGTLDVLRSETEVRVRQDVTRRVEHARILPVGRALYKRRCSNELGRVSKDSSNDTSAPMHHDVEFRVRYAETDQMGVVYHTNYLIWCEVGRTDFIRARGMSYADMERAGVGLAVSELSARFHAAARYDDMIRVRTTLAEVRSRGIIFDYLVTRSATGDRLMSARTSLVSIDASGRPIALPAAVRTLFQR